MNIGDLIFCRDKKDMLQKMYDCQEKGIETEFYYDDPDDPYCLIVISIGGTRDD